METLSIHECDRKSVGRVLTFSANTNEVEEFAQYMSNLPSDITCIVVSDLPGDVVLRCSLPRLSRSQTTSMIDGLLLNHLSQQRYKAGYLTCRRLFAGQGVARSVGQKADLNIHRSTDRSIDQSAETSLFALGDAFENSCWFPVLSKASHNIERLYSASTLSELTCQNLLKGYHRLLLCQSMDLKSLRLLYYEQGVLCFTRMVSFSVADENETLKQIEDTRQYILDEHSNLTDMPMVTAIVKDILPANRSTPDRVNGDNNDVQVVINSLTESLVITDQANSDSITEAALIRYLTTAHKSRRLKRPGLHRQLALRDCRSSAMRATRRESVMKQWRRRMWHGLQCVLILITAIALSGGLYLTWVNSVMRDKTAGLSSDIADLSTSPDSQNQNVLLMRDVVMFRRNLTQQVLDPKTLLKKLAGAVDTADAISLESIAWAATPTSTEYDEITGISIVSRSTLPPVTDDTQRQESTVLQIEGFIETGYQSLGEGYSWYQGLIRSLEQQHEFDILAQEIVPFDTQGDTQGDTHGPAGNFSLFLSFDENSQ